MSHVWRDKITPTRVLVPINGVETKSDDQWSTQVIEIMVAFTDGRLICRKTFVPIDSLGRDYRKEEL